MAKLSLEMPDSVLAALRDNPEDFLKEFRLAAAAYWYRVGRVSQEVGAQIAGLDRTDFLLALARMGIASFAVDFEDLDQELSHG